ncbi:MAG TPA: hypothetical protein VFV70_01170 [Hyphomonadaceae bacterium]|nr:hypothetical protein [Hyphomonadaceae bacterium]
MANSFSQLNSGMLARKGQAKPSEEPRFGSMPWAPPKGGAPAVYAPPPGSISVPGSESAAAAAALASPPAPPAPAPGSIAEQKVRLDQVASAWATPSVRPALARSSEESAWVPNKPSPPLDGSSLPVKTTLRMTHALARAVRLASVVLDKPQQEILTDSLLQQLEALACTDLANCACFKTVVIGLAEAKALAGPASANSNSDVCETAK